MTSARGLLLTIWTPRRRAGLCEVTPLRPDQFLTVNTDLEPAAAAADYAARLAAVTIHTAMSRDTVRSVSRHSATPPFTTRVCWCPVYL